jgi:hypothetical protein
VLRFSCTEEKLEVIVPRPAVSDRRLCRGWLLATAWLIGSLFLPINSTFCSKGLRHSTEIPRVLPENPSM